MMNKCILRKENYSIKEKLYISLLSCFFILQPFYLFNSGLPQISDYIMMLLIMILIITNKRYKVNRRYGKFILTSTSFVMYTFIVNSLWSMFLYGDSIMIKPALFYIYNLLIMLSIFLLYSKVGKSLYKIIFNSLSTTILIQFLIYVEGTLRIYSHRQVLFFNNPNQLGYFGLLAMAMIVLTAKKNDSKPITTTVVILLSYFLVMISHSKAAIVSGFGILLVNFIPLGEKTKNQKKVAEILLVIVIIGFLLYFINEDLYMNNTLFNSLKRRILSIGQDSDDSLMGRGYDRIIDYPQYLILGAGEGGLYRFNTTKELHSTLGTILFSYGIIGFLLFSFMLLQVMWKQSINNKILIISILLYGLTHQGLRQPMFWILLSLLFLARMEDKIESK